MEFEDAALHCQKRFSTLWMSPNSTLSLSGCNMIVIQSEYMRTCLLRQTKIVLEYMLAKTDYVLNM